MITMTPEQATAEATLLMIRKMRRLHPEAFADVMGRLPEGARAALNQAEIAADVQRDKLGGAGNMAYPEPEVFPGE
jgi:hypothetical protein